LATPVWGVAVIADAFPEQAKGGGKPGSTKTVARQSKVHGAFSAYTKEPRSTPEAFSFLSDLINEPGSGS